MSDYSIKEDLNHPLTQAQASIGANSCFTSGTIKESHKATDTIGGTQLSGAYNINGLNDHKK